MEPPLDKDKALKILREAIIRAFNKCEPYRIGKKFDTACWVFLNEVGTVFREYGYPEYRVKIELSRTVKYKTKEVFQTIPETEEQRKLIEKIFMEGFFDYPDEDKK